LVKDAGRTVRDLNIDEPNSLTVRPIHTVAASLLSKLISPELRMNVRKWRASQQGSVSSTRQITL
jgi:hypothetical protein